MSKKAPVSRGPEVSSVMDRLKQLYFTSIKPLEEAYSFGACVSVWMICVCLLRAPTHTLPPPPPPPIRR